MIDGESQPSDKVLYVNETKIFTCVAEGFPNPTVQWYKGNQSIDSTISYNYKTLDIPTSTSHTTKYTCIATNHAGAKNRTKKLEVSVEVKGMYLYSEEDICSYMYIKQLYYFFVARCPKLADPENGRIKYDNEEITYFGCNKPYKLKGRNVLLCKNGEWNGTPPVCTK